MQEEQHRNQTQAMRLRLCAETADIVAGGAGGWVPLRG